MQSPYALLQVLRYREGFRLWGCKEAYKSLRPLQLHFRVQPDPWFIPRTVRLVFPSWQTLMLWCFCALFSLHQWLLQHSSRWEDPKGGLCLTPTLCRSTNGPKKIGFKLVTHYVSYQTNQSHFLLK